MPDRLLVPAPLARGSRGAVVAPHHLATQAGLAVLADGGSAVDAAIATNSVLGVVLPSGCGIGGDAFWLVWDPATGGLVGLNGSGRAPAAADAAALRARGLTELPRRGVLSVTVPGAVRSWSVAHTRWGRLSRDRVLREAIALAQDGFPATDGFRSAVEATAPIAAAVDPAGGFGAVFRSAGRPWRIGERVRLPALAATLGRLASEGFDAFYDSDLGERQATLLADAGGAFTADDFRAQGAEWTEPLSARYRGMTVATHPPNSSGIIGLEILRIAETMEPPAATAFGAGAWSDPRWVHHVIEAAKLATVDRERTLCDPAADASETADLLSDAHIRDLVGRIDPGRASWDLPPCRALVHGTIFLAAVDADGGAVSLIQSNASGFGSGIVDPVTGIHYQSRGASFSLQVGVPGELVGGRRPPHSLLPAMTFAGPDTSAGPVLVHGSMGGDAQPQILAQVVSAFVDGGADPATAIGAPRWHVGPAAGSGPPTTVVLESRIDPAVRRGLAERGHDLVEVGAFDGALGHAHAIELIDGGPAHGGSLAAATDPRSEGLPATR